MSALSPSPITRPLPEPLAPLGRIAENFWWTWSPHQHAAELFSRLDPALWESTGHNPILLLNAISEHALNDAAGNHDFLTKLAHAAEALADHLENMLNTQDWYTRLDEKPSADFLAAYFCAEFGVADCFQIYSGGLGLLAGDHLKSAADLALPLVGVGLLYRNGYFRQALDAQGYQREVYPPTDAPNQALRRVLDSGGNHLKVFVDLPAPPASRSVACALWRADVGKTRLYLLDTNLDENSEHDRDITANLYLGDQHRRIQQEIVLGIGGVRALAAVGEKPTVFHMNEGHAAFMALERIRVLRETYPDLTFDQVREAAAAAHIFTTHTPVPAGIDRFAPALITQYFGGMVASLGLDIEGLLALGREDVADRSEAFSMAVLAIRTSRFANGVSRLHGRVSRHMWKNIWPGTPDDDVPIGHVTNGIHTASWIAPSLAALLENHVDHAPPAWRTAPQDAASWTAVETVSDEELWAQRNDARRTLVEFVRHRAAATAHRLDRKDDLAAAATLLNPDTLTIGFARRFAGYKRGTLLLHDTARIVKLLNDPARPLQLIVAGKAHPGDGWGKDLIKQLVEFSRLPAVRGKIVFLEDYDIHIARHLVRGCDLWLNTPIRGLEASGTSGMKAALNGCLNCSIRDGWWDEGYAANLGYEINAIGAYLTDEPRPEREEFEANALYRVLEENILPDFYTRDNNTTPTRWLGKVRASIATLAPTFSTHRMVVEYATNYYFPAHAAAAVLAADNLTPAKELADHIARYRAHWQSLRIRSVFGEHVDGQGLVVNAIIRLDGLNPDEVRVEVALGTIRDEHIQQSRSISRTQQTLDTANAPRQLMKTRDHLGDGTHHYHAIIPADQLGAGPSPRGFQVRIVPGDPRLVTPYVPALITSSAVYPLTAEDRS